MVIKVRYIGSRSCKADGITWAKYDEREVTNDFYEKYKNQGFELVTIKKEIETKENNVKKVIETFVGKDNNSNNKIIRGD